MQEDRITLETTVPDEEPEYGLIGARGGKVCGTVTVLVGSQIAATYALRDAVTVLGRDPRAQVSFEDDRVSRKQCRIHRHGEAYTIEDLESFNGTYVDNLKVSTQIPLRDGARIQIGNTLLRFALQDELEQEVSRRVYEASVRDSLTGLFNRRYLDERLASEFAFATRQNTPLCALLIDIDHFKRINDEYGHPAGDAVLCHVSGQLRQMLRVEDVLARYGGEEFAIVARIDVQGARVLADRLRAGLEQAKVRWDNRDLSVTVSIGVCHNRGGLSVGAPDGLIVAADRALYEAKRAGRNRVQFAVSPGKYSQAQEDKPPVVRSQRTHPRFRPTVSIPPDARGKPTRTKA